jgi:DnaJ-domain-containing protein 1
MLARRPGKAGQCDHPGCTGKRLYRAPRARNALNSYYWFCLEHVRLYNRAWNFYAGMSAEEVEACIREDVVGWRPTWPMEPGRFPHSLRGNRYDPFGLFGKGRGGRDATARSRQCWPRRSPERKALTLFDLEPPVTLADLKARYKELVKRHHPDANGGDKTAEEKLKRINGAYRILKRAVAA